MDTPNQPSELTLVPSVTPSPDVPVTPEIPLPPEEPTLTHKQVVQGVLNAPALAEDEFALGGRTFKILDLEYDEYIEFTEYLRPLFSGIMSSLSAQAGHVLPDIDLAPAGGYTVDSVFQFCKKDLPRMACIVCGTNDKTITVEWVKKSAKTPFKLAAVVMQQVERNNIIGDFMSFFAQVLPTMQKMGMGLNLS